MLWIYFLPLTYTLKNGKFSVVYIWPRWKEVLKNPSPSGKADGREGAAPSGELVGGEDGIGFLRVNRRNHRDRREPRNQLQSDGLWSQEAQLGFLHFILVSLTHTLQWIDWDLSWTEWGLVPCKETIPDEGREQLGSGNAGGCWFLKPDHSSRRAEKLLFPSAQCLAPCLARGWGAGLQYMGIRWTLRTSPPRVYKGLSFHVLAHQIHTHFKPRQRSPQICPHYWCQ